MGSGDDFRDDQGPDPWFEDVDLSELFPDEDGDELDRVTQRQSFKLVPASPRPDGTEPGPSAGPPQTSGGLRLGVDRARVGVVTMDDLDSELHLELTLHNAVGKVVELEEVLVVFRDAEGRPLAVETEYFGTRFAREQDIICTLSAAAHVMPALATVEFLVDYDFDFQVLVASALIELPSSEDDLDPRGRLPLFVREAPPAPGLPRFEVELSAFSADEWGTSILMVVHIREEGASDEPREGVLALRDERGRILDRQEVSFSHTTSPFGDYALVQLDMDPEVEASVERVDLALSGTVVRRESLGIFELVNPN